MKKTILISMNLITMNLLTITGAMATTQLGEIFSKVNAFTPTALITSDLLNKSAAGYSVNDIVKNIPSLYTKPSDDDKNISMNGMDPEFSRVLINGNLVTDSEFSKTFDIGRLPLHMIYKIQVVRNGMPEFESDGLAGKVNIITKKSVDRDFQTLDGAFGTQEGHSAYEYAYTYAKKISDYESLMINIAGSKNPYIKHENTKKAGVLAEDEKEIKDIRNHSLFALYNKKTSNGEFTFEPQYILTNEKEHKGKKKYVSGGGVKEVRAESGVKKIETVGFNSSLGTDANRYKISFLQSEFNKLKPKKKSKASPFVPTLDKTEMQKHKDTVLSFNNDRMVSLSENGILKFGVMGRQKQRNTLTTITNANNKVEITPRETISITEKYLAGYVQNERNISPKLKAVIGLRLEKADTESGSKVASKSVSASDTSLLPTVALEYIEDENRKYHLSISQLLNRPTLSQMAPYSEETDDDHANPDGAEGTHSDYIEGNPNLKPAKSLAVDTGFTYENKFAYASFNVFYRDITGLIETVVEKKDNNNEHFKYQNISKAQLVGITMQQKFAVNNYLTLNLNETFAKSTKTNVDGSKGKINDQNKTVLNAKLNYDLPAYKTVFTVGTSYSVAEETGFILKTTDFKASKTFKPNLDIYFMITDVFNTEQKTLKSDGSIETRLIKPSYYVGFKYKF